MMQSGYLPVLLSLLTTVIGFVLMYGAWYAEKRVVREYEHPETRGRLWRAFLRHPVLVGVCLVLPPFVGVVIVANGSEGVFEWLSPGARAIGVLVSGLLAVGIYAVFVIHELRRYWCLSVTKENSGRKDTPWRSTNAERGG